MNFADFKKQITDYYHKHKRVMPWRETANPYLVYISEIMLQQTQVPRVMQKYPLFTKIFPDFASLSTAGTRTLLETWQGMGYNRRALYMRDTAGIIIKNHNGILPRSPTLLQTFPGIGPATAGSLVAFAYNLPTVFIETNIRRVFIHFFFKDQEGIDDKNIYPLVQKSLDQENPREWYYALMDYGTMLGKTVRNPNKRSKHYIKQSSFEGSDRQIRGRVLKELIRYNILSKSHLIELFPDDADRVKRILSQMQQEGFVREKSGKYFIK